MVGCLLFAAEFRATGTAAFIAIRAELSAIEGEHSKLAANITHGFLFKLHFRTHAGRLDRIKGTSKS
jgi:hypothetical protein